MAISISGTQTLPERGWDQKRLGRWERGSQGYKYMTHSGVYYVLGLAALPAGCLADAGRPQGICYSAGSPV